MTCLYGIHPVLESLRAGDSRVERVSVERGLRSSRIQEIIDLARRRNIPVSFEERSWLDRKAGGGRHQGVICSLAGVGTVEVEAMLSSAGHPGLLLILDGIEDPQNLGAVLRSAAAAAADGVILPQRRSAALSAAAVKASAGGAAHVKIARAPNLARLIELLKERGYWIVGLDSAAGRRIWEADLAGPIALVLGSEGSGMRRLVRELCDFLFAIPLPGKVGSYNVSVAAGIALYECIRQRSSLTGAPP